MKRGDDVVCINDKTLPEQFLGIQAGETYTVRWAGRARSYLAGDYFGIRLVGVNRGICPEFGDDDPPFRASRFRPVVAPKQKQMEVEAA